ncbi:D-alanyl-D-alanine carboxypeptidase/D-alanyl-D-alanine-endopeptidase [Neisseria sp. ZJ106]|uniref:D-alanyl-D-alanine carboxypeptidase/D-alanyl-D-alanine-endopeptidase n=1 Tax=Neisseria lisongii TaxID=2912188 RepID=A0ABY7RJL2_9NEIS|nr:D-alanyl-D-alanine carboxypeptidase/D-alanyl-D-alanine-endopeptidase [Neisseria lisongii]MCF7521591.1 D-alanyl-D-alanine carboxypeptidase/D-alanyl-D-alanine-endopeptidase [Neisseria lisongii]WCL71807.1 D-alanyl-D-alanine carboxypeptidase/D-alanyl-D-alanine-endopeptidase [Neisseria lisongii]
MMNKRHLFSACLALCSLSASAWDFGRIPPEEAAVYVQQLDNGKIWAAHREDTPVNPASTMKLVTTFTALNILGSDYRWNTEFKSSAKIQGDTLDGDLYWQGSGNPTLEQDDIAAAQQQLREQGIRHIKGSLVLDRSLWGSVPNPPEFADDEGETFMTPPDPNMLAYKVVWLTPQTDEAGNVQIHTKPPLPDIPQDNQVRLSRSTAACPSLANHLQARFSDGILHLTGNLPSACLGKEMFVNMLTAPDFARRSFINQWRENGGRISDGMAAADTPKQAKTLAAAPSKPLAEILTAMNKHSNNLIARSVFLKLGKAENARTAARQAAEAVKQELALSGVDVSPLILENGSGLSRRERVSAKMMGQMLEKAYFSPFAADFIDTLPIAGEDGTLKGRLKILGHPLRLKTGTLKDVRALAGYWLGDKPLVVVVIINSPKATAYLKDLDRLVTQIVNEIQATQESETPPTDSN